MQALTGELPMRVIVCGGRDYVNQAHLFAWLDKFHAAFPIDELIEGGARGADRLALQWANKNEVAVVEVRPKWGKHGKRAGMIRNQEMLDLKPDAVIAFPGGTGTNNMTRIARLAKIKVYDGSTLEW
jgi:hypothetical protein